MVFIVSKLYLPMFPDRSAISHICKDFVLFFGDLPTASWKTLFAVPDTDLYEKSWIYHSIKLKSKGPGPLARKKITRIDFVGTFLSCFYTVLQYCSLKNFHSSFQLIEKCWNIYIYIFKFFVGHKSFLWGHWCPCFGLLVTSALGFKARVDSLACVLPRLCTTDSSDSPLVQHLPFPPIVVYTV